MGTKQRERWNLFARELEEILATHRQSLSTLDPRLGIAEERARRLLQSLDTPGSFPVLSLAELDKLELELPLSWEEWSRLRAALLTTAIQRMLTYRLGPERALRVAANIAPLLDEAQWEQFQEDGLGSRRGPDREPLEDTRMDQTWRKVWDTLDSATLALQLSYAVFSNRERLKQLREAQADFEELLEHLDGLDEGVKSLPIWPVAYTEAEQGLATANERLEDLDEA